MLKRTDLFPEKVSRFRMSPKTTKLVFSTVIALLLIAELIPAPTPAKSTTKTAKTTGQQVDLTKTVKPNSKSVKAFDQTLKDSHFSGTALVVKDGKVIMHKGYGSANAAEKKANGPVTTFPIASTAKFMTAVLVGQQVEKGKLSYDSKLSEFYPTVPNADQITVRDLLTMTSGLRQPKQPDSFTSEQENIDFSVANSEKIGEAGTGVGWSYQPINYRLLAGILMKVSHESYTSLAKKAFNKNGQLHIGFYPEFKKDKNLAQAYQVGTNHEVDVTKVEYERETGTGNVSMTTGQLYSLYRDFFQKKYVKHPSKLLQQRLPAHYAAGLYGYDGVYEGHGIFSGYESNAVVSKEGKNAVILLSNQYDGQHSVQKLGQTYFEQMTGQKAP